MVITNYKSWANGKLSINLAAMNSKVNAYYMQEFFSEFLCQKLGCILYTNGGELYINEKLMQILICPGYDTKLDLMELLKF